MALRYSVTLRNAGLDARVAAIGPNALLRIYSESGAPLVSMRLGKPWMKQAENGAVTKDGDWSGIAKALGKAKSFRICDAKGAPHIEGAIPEDMDLDPNIAPGQVVTVSGFTIRAGNG